MNTPPRLDTEAQLIAALRTELEQPDPKELGRVYARLAATVSLGVSSVATVGTAQGATGMVGGASSAPATGVSTAAAGPATTTAAAASSIVVAAGHPALMMLAGAVLGAGVMTGIAVVQDRPSSTPTVQTLTRLSGRTTTLAPSQRQLRPMQVATAAPALRGAIPNVREHSVAKPPMLARAPRTHARAASEDEARRPSESLSEQQVLLDAARLALARSDSPAALEALSFHRTRFPRTALAEERDALTIKALRATGRDAEARLRADEFLRRYPASVFQEAVAPSKP